MKIFFNICFYLILWLLSSFFIGIVAVEGNKNFMKWFLISLFCSPLVGLTALHIISQRDKE